MFARSVSVQLKPNSVAEFTQLIERETLPTLRKQKGFKDQISMVVLGGTEVLSISLWETRENAEAYNRDAYQGVLKALGKVIEGTPHIRTYEVANSTFHKIAAHVAANA
jgi:heme-degrading monooxygenase HmoA